MFPCVSNICWTIGFCCSRCDVTPQTTVLLNTWLIFFLNHIAKVCFARICITCDNYARRIFEEIQLLFAKSFTHVKFGGALKQDMLIIFIAIFFLIILTLTLFFFFVYDSTNAIINLTWDSSLQYMDNNTQVLQLQN